MLGGSVVTGAVYARLAVIFMNNLPVLDRNHDLAILECFEFLKYLEFESVFVLVLNFNPFEHPFVAELVRQTHMTVELVLSVRGKRCMIVTY